MPKINFNSLKYPGISRKTCLLSPLRKRTMSVEEFQKSPKDQEGGGFVHVSPSRVTQPLLIASSVDAFPATDAREVRRLGFPPCLVILKPLFEDGLLLVEGGEEVYSYSRHYNSV